MADITVVYGPPCAGKSTFVHDHAKAGDIRIDLDALASALGSPSEHDHQDHLKRVAQAARHAAIGNVLSGTNAPAWIIHSSPKPADIDRYQAAGAKLHLVDPGASVALDRARTANRSASTVAAIEKWYADHLPQKSAIIAAIQAARAQIGA